MNLKKEAGKSSAESRKVKEAVSRDRDLILREVETIDPSIVLAGGAEVNNLLQQLAGLPKVGPYDSWLWGNRRVVATYHPSHRKSVEQAAEVLRRSARQILHEFGAPDGI